MCVSEADAFYDIALYCNELDKKAQENPILFRCDAYYFFPAIVNLSFATELYLKALIAKYNVDYPREHGLISLFERLPEGTKNELIHKYDERIVYKVTLVDTLRLHQEAFAKWRYAFEKKNHDVEAYFDNLRLAAEVIREYLLSV